MIVGMALKKVFEGKTIAVDGLGNVSVQFHFGDQKEFNAWVVEKMKNRKQKYPLIWYVITPHERSVTGKIKVDSQLILFQGNDKTQMMNDARYATSYLKYLEPTYEMVNKVLTEHPFVTLLNLGKPLKDHDEPNYGVDSSNPNDFTNSSSKGTKSIGAVIVDAKIIKLKMEITPKCILI